MENPLEKCINPLFPAIPDDRTCAYIVGVSNASGTVKQGGVDIPLLFIAAEKGLAQTFKNMINDGGVDKGVKDTLGRNVADYLMKKAFTPGSNKAQLLGYLADIVAPMGISVTPGFNPMKGGRRRKNRRSHRRSQRRSRSRKTRRSRA